MQNISMLLGIATSILTTVFVAGGFYVLTNWRIKRLEESQEMNQEIIQRLTVMETKIDLAITNNKNSNP